MPIVAGFDSGFSSNMTHGGGGFDHGFRARSVAAAVSSALYTNLASYIVNGVRVQSGVTTQPGLLGAVFRSNSTGLCVLKVTSTVTVAGFKLIRTPEASGNWLVTSFDDMDVVLSVKSGGSINGGALSTKTFATNSKVRSATRTSPVNVNSYLNEYDTYTVYDASAVTLSAGTYNMVYRGTSTQIGIAHLRTSIVPLESTTSIYIDPADGVNTNSYVVVEILSSAP